MALLRVLPFDPEGRPVAFDMWHDDLQMYLLSDSRDSVSLFDLVSGAAPAPPATADILTRSQWLSRDATARLAIRNHLPATECAYFGKHRTAQALYDAVVARYSSPATAALGRLLLPYLFPELSAFCHSSGPAPMFITLYFIVTRLPDSLRSIKDHFLTLDPTSLTVDLLEQHLLTAETSAVAVAAARGTPRSPFFEGCSPSPLSSSFASAAAADVSVPEDLNAALTSTKRRNSKGKGGRGSGGGSGGGGGGSGRGSGGSGRGGGGGGGSGGGGGNGGGGTCGSRSGPQHGGSGGGRGQQQQRRSETQTPQQLREWLVQRGAGEGSETCPYVIRMGARAGKTCGRFHTERRSFAHLDVAWRTEFGDDVERPRWAELLRSGVAIYDLHFDVIISAMYALSFSAEGDCYWSVPPDPGIAAAALGASASGTPPGTAPGEALHTFTLDSGASRCFFRDSTTLTPLPTPIPVRMADPSRGPVVASSSTVLSCPAVPSGSLSGLHLPSFSTNLVSTAALQDAMVTTTTPGGQRVSICTCTRTGRHLATFTCRPASSLYTLAAEPPQVAATALVSASGQVAAACLCRLLSHQTLLLHHCLGHPSLPRLCGMHSRLLVSGLPRSLPPLPPSPAPPCLPCVEGRQRAAPHSSSFSPTSAPRQTLHMDEWGPARVNGQGRERYFVLVVDDYTRYTTVFPSCLDPLDPHSLGGEFSSDLLRDFCHGEGITQSFTLPDSPQQNGIAERRIGLVMEVARTSMIHAAAPHFLWLFAVWYAAHQLNLWPCVSLPETSPTLVWTGKVGNASVFRVWGSRAFVRDTSANKLSARASPCVFLGFVPDAPGWQFYHPASRRVLPSQDVTFDESVPFYRLSPYRSAPSPPPPLFLAPGPPPVDPLPPQGPAPSGVSQVDPLPVQVAVVLGAAQGVASGGAASGGAEPGGAGSEGARSGGAEPEGVEPGGAESEGAELEGAETEGVESGGAEPRGAASSGGPTGASPRLSSQQLREWLVQHAHRRSVAPGAGEPGGAGAGGAAVTTGFGEPTESGAAGAGGAGAGEARVGGPGAGGAGVAGAGAVDPGAGGTGGTVRPRPYFVPLLEQVLGVSSSPGLPPPFLCPPPDQSQPPLQPASPLPVPSPYTEQSGGLTERREPASRPVSPVRTVRRAPRSRPPPVPGTHTMALRPSSVPLRVQLPAPPESSLPEVPDRESDRARAASPTVARLLTTAVTYPSFESAAASALVAELLDFAAACRLDYASALVAEPVPASPPSVGGECALGTDVLEDRQEDLVFATADTEALTLVKSELQKRHTCTDLGELRSYLGLQITRDRARRTITLTESHMVHQVLQRFGFQYSSPQLTPLSTSHSLSAPPLDESVEPSGPYPELVGCVITSGMGLVLGGRGPVVLTGHADASWVDDSATQRSSQGYTFSLGSSSDSWQSTCSSSVLSSSCEAEIYAGAMAAQELRWLIYLLTDLREQPRSPPVLYRGQLRLAYVATRANTADVFTKALPPGDHQRFVTVLGLLALPFLIGCSPVPLLPSVASSAAVDLVGTEEVGAASAPSGRRRNSKGKGSKGGGGGSGGSSGGGGGGGGGGGRGGGGTGSGGVSGGGGGRGGGGGGGGGSGSGGGRGGGGGAGQGAAAQRGCFGGSQRQQQLRARETPSVQQLRVWYAGREWSGGAGPCTYVLCTGTCSGENVPIFDLDFDAILAAMYALADSAEGDCYLSVPPDPGIAAAALGASASAAPGAGASAAPGAGASPAPGAGASTLSGTAPTESLHTFTLDSGASRSFFRDSTTLTPLSRPVAVSLADPSGGPVLAHSSTVLPCPAAPSGLLSGLHLPSFSTNLVSGADLQDAWVAASNQVFAAVSRSSPAAAPYSCRPLSHKTLLWHHRLGHPSLPRLRGMASRALVSGSPRTLPPLPLGPAPTCVPCFEGRHRAAPHSSSIPPTEAPLQTLHMDVWGPALVRGQGHERYFLLVIDDYSRFTTVFPLRSKDRAGEFSSDLLRAFCRSEGIRQTFTLPASPQQNGIAEHRIGMVMEQQWGEGMGVAGVSSQPPTTSSSLSLLHLLLCWERGGAWRLRGW
ncbi:unnamed protein product [Closterium sp. NIES-53]